MGRFFNGMVVGATIALLVTPLRGDEMRRLVSERLNRLGVSLPTGTTNSSVTEPTEPEALSEAKENVRENLAKPKTKVMGQTTPKTTNTPTQGT